MLCDFRVSRRSQFCSKSCTLFLTVHHSCSALHWPVHSPFSTVSTSLTWAPSLLSCAPSHWPRIPSLLKFFTDPCTILVHSLHTDLCIRPRDPAVKLYPVSCLMSCPIFLVLRSQFLCTQTRCLLMGCLSLCHTLLSLASALILVLFSGLSCCVLMFIKKVTLYPCVYWGDPHLSANEKLYCSLCLSPWLISTPSFASTASAYLENILCLGRTVFDFTLSSLRTNWPPFSLTQHSCHISSYSLNLNNSRPITFSFLNMQHHGIWFHKSKPYWIHYVDCSGCSSMLCAYAHQFFKSANTMILIILVVVPSCKLTFLPDSIAVSRTCSSTCPRLALKLVWNWFNILIAHKSLGDHGFLLCLVCFNTDLFLHRFWWCDQANQWWKKTQKLQPVPIRGYFGQSLHWENMGGVIRNSLLES